MRVSPLAQELDSDEEPLLLEGFLALERRLPDASDAQHIANKLLYDATNEAIIGVYKAANRIKVHGSCQTHLLDS